MTADLPRYRVQRTPDAPAPDWPRAELLEAFRFPWEARPAPATQFRALHDRTHLHFRFDCADADLVLGDGATLKAQVLDSDRVEIFFAPDLSLTPYYCLEMDPRGQTLAYAGRHHRQFDWDWQCAGLEVRGEIGDGGYCVRGRLPLATLRELGVLRDDRCFAGLYRGEFCRRPDGGIQPGWMAWVDPQTAKPDFHIPATFGVLEFVPH